MKILDRLLRPAGDPRWARASASRTPQEAAEAIHRAHRRGLEARIEAKAKSDGLAEADKEAQKLLGQIDKLYADLSGSDAYEHQRSVQAEMLVAINERKTALLAVRRKIAGQAVRGRRDSPR